MPPTDDDLEPIPVPGAAPPDPHRTGPLVRDRFLVALAVVAAIGIIALAVQLRSIARDAAHEAECSEALVAIVSSTGGRGGADERDRLEAQLRNCLGADASVPGFGSDS